MCKAITTLLLMVSAVVPAWAQRAPADPFAGLHQHLATAADDVLAAAQRAPASGEAVLPSPGTPAIEQTNPSLRRIQQFRLTIDPILRDEGLPPQLASVALVESGGNPQALSPKGALGLWQFMPDTARRYGLMVTAQRDDRLDPARSTRAAARYLRDLYARFGDWPLALAAYNAGEPAVQRALGQVAGANAPVGFMELSRRRLLPAETRAYVPAVLASWGLVRSSSGTVPNTSGLRLYASMTPGH